MTRQVDSDSVTLSENEQYNSRLTWDTSDTEPGEYTVTVQGDNDSYSFITEVNAESGVSRWTFDNADTDTGTFYHMVWVRLDTSSTLYIDGSSEDSNSSLSANTFNANNFVIGAIDEGVTGLYHDGTIDDVRVYNKALSSTEVSNLYNTGFIQ